MNKPAEPTDELDEIINRLVSTHEILNLTPKARSTIKAYTENLVLEARIAGYKEALYDSGYGYAGFTSLESVESKLAELTKQLEEKR